MFTLYPRSKSVHLENFICSTQSYGRASISIHGTLVSLRGHHEPHSGWGKGVWHIQRRTNTRPAQFHEQRLLNKDRPVMDLLTVYQYGSCSLGSDANRTNTHCSLADALVLTSRGSLLCCRGVTDPIAKLYCLFVISFRDTSSLKRVTNGLIGAPSSNRITLANLLALSSELTSPMARMEPAVALPPSFSAIPIAPTMLCDSTE